MFQLILCSASKNVDRAVIICTTYVQSITFLLIKYKKPLFNVQPKSLSTQNYLKNCSLLETNVVLKKKSVYLNSCQFQRCKSNRNHLVSPKKNRNLQNCLRKWPPPPRRRSILLCSSILKVFIRCYRNRFN